MHIQGGTGSVQKLKNTHPLNSFFCNSFDFFFFFQLQTGYRSSKHRILTYQYLKLGTKLGPFYASFYFPPQGTKLKTQNAFLLLLLARSRLCPPSFPSRKPGKQLLCKQALRKEMSVRFMQTMGSTRGKLW